MTIIFFDRLIMFIHNNFSLYEDIAKVILNDVRVFYLNGMTFLNLRFDFLFLLLIIDFFIQFLLLFYGSFSFYLLLIVNQAIQLWSWLVIPLILDGLIPSFFLFDNTMFLLSQIISYLFFCVFDEFLIIFILIHLIINWKFSNRILNQ